MFELLITTLLTAIFLIGLLWVLSRGGAPSYRPTRQGVVRLLERVIEGDAEQFEWDLFIGYPIHADPELDEIRRRCQALNEGTEDHPAYPSGIGSYIFNREGREQVAKILDDLKDIIANEPFQKEF